MEKQKNWHFFLIIAVIVLTLYNILPTILYYSKPLKSPINEKSALQVSAEISNRVNELEKENINWLHSYSKHLGLKPTSIELDPTQPSLIKISFRKSEEAEKFKKFLPEANSIIPFLPAQFILYDHDVEKEVFLKRNIPIHFETKELGKNFEFTAKLDSSGLISEKYKKIINDRLLVLTLGLAGESKNAAALHQALKSDHPNRHFKEEALTAVCGKILAFNQVFSSSTPIMGRFFNSFSQSAGSNPYTLYQEWVEAVETLQDTLKIERIALEQKKASLEKEKQFLSAAEDQKLFTLQQKEQTLSGAKRLIEKYKNEITSSLKPWNDQIVKKNLNDHTDSSLLTSISLEGHHPIFEKILVDWNREKIYLELYSDVLSLKGKSKQLERFNSLIYEEVAEIRRASGEKISPFKDQFEISFNELERTKSLLILDLKEIASKQLDELKKIITNTWKPLHPDLVSEAFPIVDYKEYVKLEHQKLALVLFAPVLEEGTSPTGFHNQSIYILAKGLDKILKTLEDHEESVEAKQFISDFNQLQSILKKSGFVGYNGAFAHLDSRFASDFIFEYEDHYQMVLKATRENFAVKGTKQYAVLELSDLEERIINANKIDNLIQEDLLKWRDEHLAANVDPHSLKKYSIPPPTKNPLWENFKLSLRKYFRGDEKKVLHWGLDLSGGKSVEIELRDKNNHPVTSEIDIQTGIEELYSRVNKMGVSEIQIRKEGSLIGVDFPGSQVFSAGDLIKASSMSFHVINEKFSTQNSSIGNTVNQFLQDVWNEAVITNKKSNEEIQNIALKQLYGDSQDSDLARPRSDAAQTLYDQGLRLAKVEDPLLYSVDDSLSRIALLRGDDYRDWNGQSHPLLVVFQNYALEGSHLEDVHASYDPTKGNFLSFSVKGAYTSKEGEKINPQADLNAWTSTFSKEKISGTDQGSITNGRGWRMAVILNGTVISTPALDSALKDHAMISGSFSQREVNQLEADLKAGSLSFTPHILSEKNVSPDLGTSERSHGIMAAIVALILVILTMIAYYRFGGLIASIAVIFNLIIMWAVLQNMQASLTLATLAGIILVVATAVDANVLVFERIREEFALSSRLGSAINIGYRKAMSAILDSNITTIIAAVILLRFDSGPIKGFAVSLIVGIISSMFTALFMTHYFFRKWAENPKNKTLKMSNWIKPTNFNFLKYSKLTVLISLFIITIGCGLLFLQRQTIFGMDFTGGYAATLHLNREEGVDYRSKIETALKKEGLSSQEFQIRTLEPKEDLRLFLSQSMELPGHPFHKMNVDNGLKEVKYSFQNNPRLVWIQKALEKEGLSLSKVGLEQLDRGWSSISGQMSETMKNQALLGLSIALFCIFIYITVRFEFKYAASATICLLHDVLFTLGFLAILHALHVDVQIDLTVIAALMTIVGYSLNDTIIVFDRIREDSKGMRKSSFIQVINHAINVTLSRTLMTSGTTLVALLALLCLGGQSIFSFTLVMTIGVVFGTLSSLFIAAPLMYYFHKKEDAKDAAIQVTR